MWEYIGYLASIIILVSLLMSSIKKLRWINLVGSITFAIYGFLIGSIPVGVLNIGTVLINVYYLWKMYASKDYFTILPISANTQYLAYFLNFYKKDIANYLATDKIDVEESAISFYILRNAVPSGLFVCSKFDDLTLKIDLDYVVPAYRDFQIGKYVFRNRKELFLDRGYTKLRTATCNEKHARYLHKMGFHRQGLLGDGKTSCFEIDLS